MAKTTTIGAGIGLTLLLNLTGCAVFDPFIKQPPSPKPAAHALEESIAAIDTVQQEIEARLGSARNLRQGSGLATYAGLGGAGVAAAFRATSDTILGLSTLGAVSYSFGGLYATKQQTSIYRNGEDALACLRDTLSPLQRYALQLQNSQKTLRTDADVLGTSVKRLKAENSVQSLADASLGQAVIDSIAIQRTAITARINDEDIQSAPILPALRSIVSTINSQLEATLPDPAALARAGSALAGQVVVPGSSTPTGTGGGVSPPKAGAPSGPHDPDLAEQINAANADIGAARTLLASDIKLATISCSVATTTVIPISISIPGGATAITYDGKAASYQISGGTGFYIGPSWTGNNPSAFVKVIIQSPNSLVISPAGTPIAGDYSFDIFDGSGNHLASPQKFSVVSTSAPPSPNSLSITGATNNTVQMAPGAQATLSISGGTAPYTISWDTSTPADTVLIATIDNTQITLKAGAGASGSFKLRVTDSTGAKLATPITVTIKAPAAKPTALAVAGLTNGVLTLTPKIATESHKTLAISGGTPFTGTPKPAPYKEQWAGKDPGTSVSHIVGLDGKLSITATDSATDGTYTMRVTDSTGQTQDFKVVIVNPAAH